MARRSFLAAPLAVAIFGAWTTLVWLQRIANIAGDDELVGGERTFNFVRAAAFVIAGIAVLVVAVRPVSAEMRLRVVAAAGLVSTALWVQRFITIPGNGHTTGFVVVHMVLGAISIGLAVWAFLAVRPAAQRRESSEVPGLL